MNTQMTDAPNTTDTQRSKTITLTRLLDAPLALVWQAFTDPAMLAQWWGPEHFDAPNCEVDLRPGGLMRLDMRSPDGVLMPMSAVFHEIVDQELLVFSTRAVEDEQGVAGIQGHNRLRFEAVEHKTRLTLEATAEAQPAWIGALAGFEAGWNQSFDKLGRSLQQEALREIVLSRVVKAPRELVWQAWTSREHVGQWWGPAGFTTTIHEMDVRPGGVWRYMMHGPDGTDYPNRVTYKEIEAPARLAYHHDADDDIDPGFEAEVTFREHPEGTEVTLRNLLPTPSARAFVIGFGAVELGHETLVCLDEYLAGLQ